MESLCSHCECLLFDDSDGHSSTKTVFPADGPTTHLEFSGEETGDETRVFQLGTPRQDHFPLLPGLVLTANAGCPVCRLLVSALSRPDIVAQAGGEKQPSGPVSLRYRYPWRMLKPGLVSVMGLSRLLVSVTFGMERQIGLMYGRSILTIAHSIGLRERLRVDALLHRRSGA
jgi:hypothetical protein